MEEESLCENSLRRGVVQDEAHTTSCFQSKLQMWLHKTMYIEDIYCKTLFLTTYHTLEYIINALFYIYSLSFEGSLNWPTWHIAHIYCCASLFFDCVSFVCSRWLRWECSEVVLYSHRTNTDEANQIPAIFCRKIYFQNLSPWKSVVS